MAYKILGGGATAFCLIFLFQSLLFTQNVPVMDLKGTYILSDVGEGGVRIKLQITDIEEFDNTFKGSVTFFGGGKSVTKKELYGRLDFATNLIMFEFEDYKRNIIKLENGRIETMGSQMIISFENGMKVIKE